MKTKDRVKQIIDDCCAGNARMASDILHSEFIIIHRDELPTPVMSEHGNGFVTATAQEFYQPSLRFMPDDGDKPGEWNRHIAYGNLAVALAVEARDADTAEKAKVKLELEAFALYVASCVATDTTPAPDWKTACIGENVERDFLAIASTAREIHGGAK